MEDNKPKRTRRTKEEIEADKLKEQEQVQSTTVQANAPYKPVKRQKKKKFVGQKDKSKYVPANLIPSYMISTTARKDCYVYAVKKVKFDTITKQQETGKEFLLTFRVSQVHETGVWDKETNEMEVNTIHQNLLSEYGLANVKLVNDPYEYE